MTEPECIRSPQSATCWIVQPKGTTGDEEPGTVPVALFIGPNAKERAQEYARYCPEIIPLDKPA